MSIQYYCKIGFAILGIYLCAAGLNEAVAQGLPGLKSISPAEYVQLEIQSVLPVSSLLTDLTYSESSLSFGAQSGDYRTFQQPETARDISIQSYGLTSFKSFRLEGRFKYVKELHDQVGWRLGRDVRQQPYYLANIHPGDWDNDRYSMNLNSASLMLNERLMVAAGADYGVEQLARYNDPRPTIQYHNLFLKMQAGIIFRPISIAFYYGFGDTTEKGSVKNYDSANDSFGRTEYNIITMLGMGSYSLQQRNTYDKTSEKQESGVTVNYRSQILDVTSDLIFGQKNVLFQRRGSVGDSDFSNRIGSYTNNYVNGNIFVDITTNAENRWQIYTETKWSDRYDFNQSFSGANYFHDSLTQSLDLYFHRFNGFSIHAGAVYQKESIVDRNASHAFNYENVSAILSVQTSLKQENLIYTFIPKIGYKSHITGEFSVPASVQNIYTDYVLSPDYYYLSSDLLKFGGAVQVKRQFTGLEVGLMVDYQYDRMIKDGDIFGNPEFYPGKSRNYVTVKLQFFH